MTRVETGPGRHRRRIRVLIADDSRVAREHLRAILDSDPDIEVTGTVANGMEAIRAIRIDKPDLVTMDIHMPGLDGFETTRMIMENHPVPIVIITGSSTIHELETSFRMIEAGALVMLAKPAGIGQPGYERSVRELITTVKLMAEVKVVRRRIKPRDPELKPLRLNGVDQQGATAQARLAAIGASTGGPPVIQQILTGLPSGFDLPVLIVQHMAEGFIDSFAEWLNQTSPLPVHLASHGTTPRPGHVYVAPDARQMTIDSRGIIRCTDDRPENGLRPAVSCLFRSVAEVYGKHSIGVLLTGMGRDGAAELKLMRDRGAVTIAQDEESSAVFGMPGEAVKLGGATYVLPAEKIAGVLTSLVYPHKWESTTTQGNIWKR
jgi:two-component system chemotaxis response regulator CheB